MSMIAIVTIAAVFSYPVVSALALKLTEATRDEFADIVRKLLVDRTVSDEHKMLISSMVDDVLDWRFMALASIVFPFFVLSRRAEKDITQSDRTFLCRKDVSRLISLHMRSVMAASPLFTALFFVTSALALFVRAFSVGMAAISIVWADTIKNVSPTAGDRHLRRVVG